MAAPAAVQQQPLTIPVLTSKEEMRAFSRKHKLDGKTIGFVPTMVRRPWAAVGSTTGSYSRRYGHNGIPVSCHLLLRMLAGILARGPSVTSR